MKNEEAYLHNVVGIYIHAQMLINHIFCIKGSSSTTNSHDKYVFNKMADVEKNLLKLTSPISRFLRDQGNLEDIEELIMEMHDIVEPILNKINK